jgi:hypothetical protein
MQRTLLALALIVTAGASYAQTMPSNEPRDPNGRPFIGRNDWVAQPGDRTNAGAAHRMNYANPDMAQAPQAMPMERGPHPVAFKDEFGFRYDAQGNRLDARGNIISPQTR